MADLTLRQLELLEALRDHDGEITTGHVHDINRSLGAPKRTTARSDITALHHAGLLIESGADDARFYLLTTKATR